MTKRPTTPTLMGTALLLATGTAACAAPSPSAPPPEAQVATAPLATAAILDATGNPAGSAEIVVPASGNPVLRVSVSGLPAGPHGVHIHATGQCDAPAFTTAGGHLNPGARQHGHENPAGSHLGDLPNISVGADGKGEISLTMPVDAAALRGALFDADGAAVVVHAKADDYRTDPSGNSGDRIACGVLKSG